MAEGGPTGPGPDASGAATTRRRAPTAPEGRAPAGGYVVGVGLRPQAQPAEVDELVRRTLAEVGLAPSAVARVATVDTRADHPALVALPWPVVGHPADDLAAVTVTDPSARVATALGTASVAEAAALLAAGPGAELVVPKRRSDAATVAVVRPASRPFDPEDLP